MVESAMSRLRWYSCGCVYFDNTDKYLSAHCSRGRWVSVAAAAALLYISRDRLSPTGLVTAFPVSFTRVLWWTQLALVAGITARGGPGRLQWTASVLRIAVLELTGMGISHFSLGG